MLLRRALDLRAALKLGVRIGLEEIRADEFYALVVLEEEPDMLHRKQMDPHGNPGRLHRVRSTEKHLSLLPTPER